MKEGFFLKKSKNDYKPSKWLYFILFIVPVIFVILITKQLDNDIWYLLSEGRYIIQNGIYHIDPLSMHEGLQVVVQNWLSASLFWLIFSAFGEMGLLVLIIICNFFICFFLYKICILISERNYVLSLMLMFICDLTLITHYVVSRPQILSYITLLALIYVLELYIKTEKPKYLIWIPIISFIQINMHASLWWMLFLFMLPYVIDSFNVPVLKLQGYKKKPLFLAIGIALLVGLINPYGYKAITFIFTSYGNHYMHIFISELLPFTITNNLCKHMSMIILFIGCIYAFFREGKIRVRYICLFCGTMILGFMSIKGFSNFILVSMFPLAYFFKDLCPKDFEDVIKEFKKVFEIILMIVSGLLTCALVYFYVVDISKLKLTNKASGSIDVLAKTYTPSEVTIYSSFNDGGYVEFRGYKPYIDPRAELYLKKNNKKNDIFKEFYDLQHGKLVVKEFLDKYSFTHLLVKDNDYLYSRLVDSNYFILYENTKEGYRLYARKDLFTDSQRKKITDAYNNAIEAAKEKENNINKK